MWHLIHDKKKKSELDEAHEDYTRSVLGAENEDGAMAQWMAETDGQLAVDVFQKDNKIWLRAAVGGIRPEDIDVDVDRDMISIRGTRRQDIEIDEDQFYLKECHWGSFSRSVVLPVSVLPEEAEAEFKDGVLTISVPRAGSGKVPVKVKK